MARTARTLVAGTLGLGILAVWLVGSANPVGACSCEAITDSNAAMAADAVFTGVAEGNPATWWPRDLTTPRTYTFEVDAVFKGDVYEHQEVATSAQGTGCGLDGVDGGERFVVFAYGSAAYGGQPRFELEPGHYAVGMCTGTREIADQRMTALGQARPPVPDPPGPGLPWGAGGVGLLVGTAAGLSLAAAVRHRRSPDHPA